MWNQTFPSGSNFNREKDPDAMDVDVTVPLSSGGLMIVNPGQLQHVSRRDIFPEPMDLSDPLQNGGGGQGLHALSTPVQPVFPLLFPRTPMSLAQSQRRWSSPRTGRGSMAGEGFEPMDMSESEINHPHTRPVPNHANQGATEAQRGTNVRRFVCVFCRSNGEPLEFQTSHETYHAGRVSCPVLRVVICTNCGATGDFAHTRKYCPLQKPAVGHYYPNTRNPRGPAPLFRH